MTDLNAGSKPAPGKSPPLNAAIAPDELSASLDSWLLVGSLKQMLRRRGSRTALLLGGRGAGKTRAGAQWVAAMAHGWPPYADKGETHRHFALVGETLADVREVMIEGPSGILSVRTLGRAGRRIAPPRFEATRRRLVWDNGAVAYMFSSDEPDSLRGPQFDAAWCDEAAKWRNAEATFDMLQFGLRLGARPRQLVTTTPKPTKLITRLLADPATAIHRMTTRDNAANLAPGFIEAMEAHYGASPLGRQELGGEMISETEGALWTRKTIEEAYLAEKPPLRRIVVAVDPPASSHRNSDACGIVAAGLDGEGRAIVLADESLGAARPLDWATRAVGLYQRLGADCLLAEVNQGGDMVSAIIAGVDRNTPVKPVRARLSKRLRAEPISLFYQQGRVKHAGHFPALEDEMCDFGHNGLSGGRSPDRLDALVWAVGELLGAPAEPRVRTI